MKTLTILALALSFAVPFVAAAQLKTPDPVGDLKDPVEMRTDYVRGDIHSVVLTPSFDVRAPSDALNVSYASSAPAI